MSRDLARFRFKDGTTLYGIYNVTVDEMFRFMVCTPDEAWRVFTSNYYLDKPAWDNLLPACDCVDGQEEECGVETDYGGGDKWSGTACRSCSIFLGPSNKYLDSYDFGWLDSTGMAESADATDLKSVEETLEGSTPSACTNED